MGHLLFIILHIIAVLFGLVLLVITIPAHLIYAAVRSNKSESRSNEAPAAAPSQVTPMKRCGQCAELVQKEALKCKHCGHEFVQTDVAAALRYDKIDEDLVAQPLAGEVNYQNALGAIVAAHKAIGAGRVLSAALSREPENRVDRSAVRADIAGLTAGYLPAQVARNFYGRAKRHYKVKDTLPVITAPCRIEGQLGQLRVTVYLPSQLL